MRAIMYNARIQIKAEIRNETCERSLKYVSLKLRCISSALTMPYPSYPFIGSVFEKAVAKLIIINECKYSFAEFGNEMEIKNTNKAAKMFAKGPDA